MVLNPSSRIHAFFLQRILLLFCPSTSCLLHPLFHHQVRIWGHQAPDIQEYVVHVPRKHRVNPLVHKKTPLTYLILSMLKCHSKVANGLYESLCRFNDITIDDDTPWKEFLLCVSILVDDFHLLQNSWFARLTAPYDTMGTSQSELKGAIERGMGMKQSHQEGGSCILFLVDHDHAQAVDRSRCCVGCCWPVLQCDTDPCCQIDIKFAWIKRFLMILLHLAHLCKRNTCGR